jgi:hypothetical protein
MTKFSRAVAVSGLAAVLLWVADAQASAAAPSEPVAAAHAPTALLPAASLGEVWVPNPQSLLQKYRRSRFASLYPRSPQPWPAAQRSALAWTLETQLTDGVTPQLQSTLSPELFDRRAALVRSAQAACGAADACAHINLQQLLVQLQPWAQAHLSQQTVMGWQRGAGLLLLTDAFGGVSLPNAQTLALTVQLLDRAAQQGLTQPLRAAMGPAQPARRPGGVGPSASFVTVNVFPQRLWQQVEQQMAFTYPLQYGLLRVQLDALEQQEKVGWVQDVLGAEAQQWTVYAPAGSTNWVASLGLRNAPAGSNFLRFMAETAALLNPAVALTTMPTKELPTAQAVRTVKVQFPGGELFFTCSKKELLVSDSQQLLRRHLRGGSQSVAWPQAPLKKTVGHAVLQPDFLRRNLARAGAKAAVNFQISWALTDCEDGVFGRLRVNAL